MNHRLNISPIILHINKRWYKIKDLLSLLSIFEDDFHTFIYNYSLVCYAEEFISPTSILYTHKKYGSSEY